MSLTLGAGCGLQEVQKKCKVCCFKVYCCSSLTFWAGCGIQEVHKKYLIREKRFTGSSVRCADSLDTVAPLLLVRLVVACRRFKRSI